MRILHLAKYYSTQKTGLELVQKLICEGIKEKKCEVDILCCDKKMGWIKKENINKVNVTKLGRFGEFFSTPFSPLYIFKALSMAKKADIIHIHAPNFWAEIVTLLLPKNKNIILTYHKNSKENSILSMIFKPLLFNCFNRVDKILVPSKEHIKNSSSLQLFHLKCKIVPFGIKTNQLKQTDNVIKDVLKIKGLYGDFTLYCGPLNAFKDLEYLIKSHHIATSNLIIIGEGPNKQKLDHLIQREKLSDKVFIFDLNDCPFEISAFYHGCNIFCVPSIDKKRDLELTQLEAMYCKKPIITTCPLSDMTSIRKENQISLLVNPEDESSLGEAINTLLKDDIMATRLGNNGKRRFERLYTFERMINNYYHCYNALLKNKLRKKRIIKSI